MRVGFSVLRPNGQPRVIAPLASVNCVRNSGLWIAVLAAALAVPVLASARADSLPEALVRTYQGNPTLNAERARLRGTDEAVPQALAGYRPQVVASLSGGLQAVRVLLPDNTVQTATLRTWIVGVTVNQTLL